MNAVRKFTMGPILRLVTKPHMQRRPRGALVHIDRFESWFDGELICISRQPRLDGARELLRRGYSPDSLLTTRAEGRSYDSFHPAQIGGREIMAKSAPISTPGTD